MLDEMERIALEMLLAGDDDRLTVLRAQLAGIEVASRELSGSGFFTNLRVLAMHPRAKTAERLVIDDVCAKITGRTIPVGFLLFVTDGALDMLECCGTGTWPEGAAIERIYYVKPKDAGSPFLVETTERDVPGALGDATERPAG